MISSAVMGSVNSGSRWGRVRGACWFAGLLVACGSSQHAAGDGAGGSAGLSAAGASSSGALGAGGNAAGAAGHVGSAAGAAGAGGADNVGVAGNTGSAGAAGASGAAGAAGVGGTFCRGASHCFQVLHREWGDSYNNAGANGVRFDSAGNVLVSASTIGPLKPLGTPNSGRDVLVKWTPALDFSWALERGTIMDGISRGVAIDGQDNAFLGAVFDSATSSVGTDALDFTVTKVAPSGAELWSKTFGSMLYDDISELATDGEGNVFAAGFTGGKFADDAALGNEDAVIVKLTSAGDRAWVHQFGSTGDDQAYGVCTDAAGNVYVTGAVAGSFAGPLVGTSELFIAKFSSTGEQVWAKQLGGAGADNGGTGIACGQDAVYAIGITTGRLDDPTAPKPADTDIVVLKYDLAGNQLWLKQWLTQGQERFSKIAVGTTGRVFIAGASTADIDNDPSTGFGGETDLFVSEWSTDGAPLWAYQYGSDSWDNVTGIAVSADGKIAVAAQVQAALPGFTITGYGDAVVSSFTPIASP